MSKIREAVRFAYEHHRTQTRRYTNEPYVQHPLRVAKRVRKAITISYTDRNDKDLEMFITNRWEDVIAAALLHDVMEDCGVSYDTLSERFGAGTAHLVDELTSKGPFGPGTRALRHQRNVDRLFHASPEAKTIKLADILDNVSTIRKFDPEFAKKYIPEKREELAAIWGGELSLWLEVRKVLYMPAREDYVQEKNCRKAGMYAKVD